MAQEKKRKLAESAPRGHNGRFASQRGARAIADGSTQAITDGSANCAATCTVDFRRDIYAENAAAWEIASTSQAIGECTVQAPDSSLADYAESPDYAGIGTVPIIGASSTAAAASTVPIIRASSTAAAALVHHNLLSVSEQDTALYIEPEQPYVGVGECVLDVGEETQAS